MTLTRSEATELVARIEAGAKAKNLLGVIMPNGKPSRECTGEYVGRLGRSLEELGHMLERAGVK
jgi:hypothetical protein